MAKSIRVNVTLVERKGDATCEQHLGFDCQLRDVSDLATLASLLNQLHHRAEYFAKEGET